MKNFLIVLIIGFCYAYPTLAQSTDDDQWDHLTSIQTEGYHLSIPSEWRQLTSLKGKAETRVFDASGIAFPSAFNHQPVFAIIYIIKNKSNSLSSAKEQCLNAYREVMDKKALKSSDYTAKLIHTASGEQAWWMSTSYYRKSNYLYQSRYDLVVYSEKEKASYIYTVTVQYSDYTQSFENTFTPEKFAEKIFSYFGLN